MNDVKVKTLGGNLRSSKQISSIVRKFQRFLDQENWTSGEPVVSSLRWNSTPPHITFIHDDSNDRFSFLRRCEERIRQLAEEKKVVMVSTFMHVSSRVKLEILCKNQKNVSSKRRNYGYYCQLFVYLCGITFQCLLAYY